MTEVLTGVKGGVGFITLNRPRALNALSLSMIRKLTATLLAWQGDAAIRAVAIRGQGKDGAFGAFCAGGDIRFFHQAALAGNPQLEDFFTEEYALNHLVHRYPKPYLAFLDGIVMGGGMGLSGQGRDSLLPSGASAGLRIVTERTRMAMPETLIGLFPDVGGGFFLGRCPGRIGEYLALTGQVIGGAAAVAAGLADRLLDSANLPALWEALSRRGLDALASQPFSDAASEDSAELTPQRRQIDHFFALPDMTAIIQQLEGDGSAWATATASSLRQRSPLMLHVALEQVRRGRALSLSQVLRMERDLVRHCLHPGGEAASQTVEGIRALAIDKDHRPRWNPARIEDVTPEMTAAFFDSPWPAYAHPLRGLV